MSNLTVIKAPLEAMVAFLVLEEISVSQKTLSFISFMSTLEAQIATLQAQVGANLQPVTEDHLELILSGIQQATALARSISTLTVTSAVDA